jgi:hypothetical protein
MIKERRMANRKKSLCSWKKEKIQEDFDTLTKIVMNPRYICTTCLRAASEERFLCRPHRLRGPRNG